MARNKTFVANHVKAIPGAAGVIQALHIWRRVLNIHTHNFNDYRSLTEEKLSCETWDGCNPHEYGLRPEFYKRLNNLVLDKWNELDPSCRVLRIYDKEAKNSIDSVTKICKSDRRHSIKKSKHLTSVASGALAKAVDLNDRLKLGQNVGKEFMEQTIQRLPDNYSKEKKGEIAKELTMEAAIQLGREIGSQQAAEALVNILDFRPALIFKDNQNSDEYSESAKERRSKKITNDSAESVQYSNSK